MNSPMDVIDAQSALSQTFRGQSGARRSPDGYEVWLLPETDTFRAGRERRISSFSPISFEEAIETLKALAPERVFPPWEL